MTGQDPGQWLLARIDAREAIEQIRAQIDELAAQLSDLDQAVEHLRITRKTLHTLAAKPAPAPQTPPPALPDHPLYQQILTQFSEPPRAHAGS